MANSHRFSPSPHFLSIGHSCEDSVSANHRQYGLKFSGQRVTVSTAGLVSRMADLGRDTRVNLAISLNATDNATRDRLMSLNRTFPIETLLEACRNYPLPRSRRITFEYIVIKGVNDSGADAHRLAKLLRPIRSKINLIPYNPHPGCDFQRPDEADVRAGFFILLSAPRIRRYGYRSGPIRPPR